MIPNIKVKPQINTPNNTFKKPKKKLVIISIIATIAIICVALYLFLPNFINSLSLKKYSDEYISILVPKEYETQAVPSQYASFNEPKDTDHGGNEMYSVMHITYSDYLGNGDGEFETKNMNHELTTDYFSFTYDPFTDNQIKNFKVKDVKRFNCTAKIASADFYMGDKLIYTARLMFILTGSKMYTVSIKAYADSKELFSNIDTIVSSFEIIK